MASRNSLMDMYGYYRSTRMENHCKEMHHGPPFVVPGVAKSAMAENHTKTDSIGLQLQVECWYEQEELPEA